MSNKMQDIKDESRDAAKIKKAQYDRQRRLNRTQEGRNLAITPFPKHGPCTAGTAKESTVIITLSKKYIHYTKHLSTVTVPRLFV